MDLVEMFDKQGIEFLEVLVNEEPEFYGYPTAPDEPMDIPCVHPDAF